MQEKSLIIKSLKINYRVFGAENGKPMLILHGWGSKSDTWQRVAELLEQKNFNVIVPDLPGFGKSQEPQKAWTLDTYVEWLNEFTLQIPELQKGFYLSGHSFGGALAAKFTIKYAQKVEKLFLIAAACIREKTAGKSTLYRISKIGKLFSFLPYYELGRKAFYKFIVRKSDYPYVSGVMKETYINTIKEDLSQKLFFIKVPTVIIWGSKDDYTPLSEAEFINKKIENSKLIVIPDASHALQIKNPEVLFNNILENI